MNTNPTTLRDARAGYFRENGFGDGGYDAKWVKFRFAGVPLAIPNTAARVRAVRYHDLHHVVTGYATDVVGEAEIGAWEIASGCAGFAAAWVLNLYAMVLGFLSGAPGRVFSAFVRGRRTGNLYRRTFDEALLDAELAEVRAELGLEPGGVVDDATAGERLAFLAWSALAIALSLATIALLLAPLAWLVRAVF